MTAPSEALAASSAGCNCGEGVRVLEGDCITSMATLPAASVQCCVTSPPEVLAYAAGVIDSDGTIGIRRSTYAMRKRGDAGQAIYSARVGCKQVTPQAVALLKDAFGGALMLQGPSVTRGRPLHYWEIHSRSAARCLSAIVPYLRIKAEQANICLQLAALIEESTAVRMARGRGHIGGASRPASITDRMDALYQEIKRLNQVGARDDR